MAFNHDRIIPGRDPGRAGKLVVERRGSLVLQPEAEEGVDRPLNMINRVVELPVQASVFDLGARDHHRAIGAATRRQGLLRTELLRRDLRLGVRRREALEQQRAAEHRRGPDDGRKRHARDANGGRHSGGRPDRAQDRDADRLNHALGSRLPACGSPQPRCRAQTWRPICHRSGWPKRCCQRHRARRRHRPLAERRSC